METSNDNLTSNLNPNARLIPEYPKAPMINPSLRQADREVRLVSNLLKMETTQALNQLYVFASSINPEVSDLDLENMILRESRKEIKKCFKRMYMAGRNLFGTLNTDVNEIDTEVNLDGNNYMVKYTKVKRFEFNSSDTDRDNQTRKQLVEKLMREILLSNEYTMKFGNRTIMQILMSNLRNKGQSGNSKIFKGFYTACQVTASGLFPLVLPISKYISGVTVYDKMCQIRRENEQSNEPKPRTNRSLPPEEGNLARIKELIQDYIESHSTVLTTYGRPKTYRVCEILFDRNPMNTSFEIKDKDGNTSKTISLYNYYQTKYNIKIKDSKQPLLKAEVEDNMKRKNDLKKDEVVTEEKKFIYLVPELVYTTGIEESKDSKDKRRDIISKTKINPVQKMQEVNSIHKFFTNSVSRADGSSHSKCAYEIAQEWGINLGDNFIFKGRIVAQPHLFYGNNGIVNPKNGTFRSGSTFNGSSFDNTNFAVFYDANDNSNFGLILQNLFDKARMKGIRFNVNTGNVRKYGLRMDTRSHGSGWESVKDALERCGYSPSNRMTLGVVFVSPTLEKVYAPMKEYFTNKWKMITQFMITKKLADQKRAGSILFNIVEQINIKMGGVNFYIDFGKEKVLDPTKICMVIGLESKKAPGGKIDYVMSSSISQHLNKTISIPKQCADNKEDKEKALTEMFNYSFKALREKGNAPKPPSYIIVYRKGGNDAQNRRLYWDEVHVFEECLEKLKKENDKVREIDPKFSYISCNLKSMLRFFEYEGKRGDVVNCANPQSGLIVDSEVIRKDRYEFFIQNQFVNQGCATPSHYEVLYQSDDSRSQNKNLPLESLEKLSFFLSFYYWTWAGAVRVPGVLKLASTAIEYYSNCLGHKLEYPENLFNTPAFV